MVELAKRWGWFWKFMVVAIAPVLIGFIPGTGPIFINLFLWWTPIPARVDLPYPEDGPERILIVAPHPDDEVLALGGTIARLVEDGHRVYIVFLTNGDANRAAKRLLTLNLIHRPTDYRALGYRRQKEAMQALGALGVSPCQVVFLGYPDQGLMALWTDHRDRELPYQSPFTRASHPFYSNSYNPDSVYCGDDLITDLSDIIALYRPTVLYTLHPEDLHPDHQAAFYLTLAALSALEPEERPEIRLYLVHARDWPYPKQLIPDLVLDPPAPLSGWAWQSLALSEEVIERKLTAVRAYSSQRWTNGRFLAGFVRLNELYAVFDPLGTANQ
jgi:LmbE family N-acetylglucosaminyl deacetylase